MSAQLLEEAGQALYGERWQSELARDLGVSDRTVRRWVAGTSELPAGIYVDLLRLTQERSEQLDGLVERLKRLRDAERCVNPAPLLRWRHYTQRC